MTQKTGSHKQTTSQEPGERYPDSLLPHSFLTAKEEYASNQLAQAKTARAKAEIRRQEAEGEASRALEKLFAEVHALRAEAEADRLRAHEEIEDATAARLEIEKRCRQIEAKAREKAQKLIMEALHQAESEASELKRRTEEEARRLLIEAATMHAAAQEEAETQRILAEAARIRTNVANLQEWAQAEKRSQEKSADSYHRLPSTSGNGNGHKDTKETQDKASPSDPADNSSSQNS